MNSEHIDLTPKEIQAIKKMRSKKHKTLTIIFISIAIVLSSAIIGGAIYAVQLQKQQSIEKQEKLRLEQEKKLADEKAKAEADEKDKDYKAQRRNDCYDIYDRERKAYSNVLSVNYWDFTDSCTITYSDTDGSTFTKKF